jgi:hypothetical protein
MRHRLERGARIEPRQAQRESKPRAMPGRIAGLARFAASKSCAAIIAPSV